MNNDIKTRDLLLFGEYEPEKYSGGIRRFVTGLNTLIKLVDLGFADEKECHNDSPKIESFIEETRDYGLITVEFEGFAVSSNRSDYRVDIDGIRLQIPKQYENTMCHFVELYSNADEFSLSFDDKYWFIRAWWD